MPELRKRPPPKETTAPAPAVKKGKKAETKPDTAKPSENTEAKAEAPPAPEELENPPEKKAIATSNEKTTGTKTDDNAAAGKDENASSSSKPDEATLPLSESSVNKLIPQSLLDLTIKTHKDESFTISSALASLSSTAEIPSYLILFTYPRASTPGCTVQACSFRDASPAYSIPDGANKRNVKVYGLSNDGQKANSNFVSKQNLNYDLLCDMGAELTGGLGMKKGGNDKGTLRGVVVLEGVKEGGATVKVWFQGGPQKTVDAVKEFLDTLD